MRAAYSRISLEAGKIFESIDIFMSCLSGRVRKA